MKPTVIGIFLGLLFLLLGVYLMHYAIDVAQAVEKEEQGTAIGVAIFLFILGNHIITIETRQTNQIQHIEERL